jgi:hypothetical protein
MRRYVRGSVLILAVLVVLQVSLWWILGRRNLEGAVLRHYTLEMIPTVASDTPLFHEFLENQMFICNSLLPRLSEEQIADTENSLKEHGINPVWVDRVVGIEMFPSPGVKSVIFCAWPIRETPLLTEVEVLGGSGPGVRWREVWLCIMGTWWQLDAYYV